MKLKLKTLKHRLLGLSISTVAFTSAFVYLQFSYTPPVKAQTDPGQQLDPTNHNEACEITEQYIKNHVEAKMGKVVCAPTGWTFDYTPGRYILVTKYKSPCSPDEKPHETSLELQDVEQDEDGSGQTLVFAEYTDTGILLSTRIRVPQSICCNEGQQ